MMMRRPDHLNVSAITGQVRLDLGITQGWIRPGNGEPAALGRRWLPVRRTLAAMLAEDRGD